MPEDKIPTRRTFLGAGAATPVLITAIQPAALALAQGVPSSLKTVMDLMIPASDGMPSASEAGGLRYLQSLMEHDKDAAADIWILDLLHERFAEPIRMRDLCAAGNMSERSLHRLFMRHLGERT